MRRKLQTFLRKYHYGIDTYHLSVNNPNVVISMMIYGCTAKEAHDLFVKAGFKFYPGAGYFWKEGSIAEAFKNNKFVPYPEWSK